MYSKTILYSSGSNDECYTPKYAVLPILKYIPNESVVWCPFDTEESEFVKEISKANKVIFSHINNGQDFYNYEPKEKWDIIISNPPFTNKRKIFERALSFNKPFALIMSNTWLNDSAPKQLFKEKDLNNSEKDVLQVELQGLFNKALGQYNISVNTDPDVRDNDPTKQNVIGLYVAIEQIEGFFRDALRQALPTEDKTKEKAQDGEEKNTDKKEA